MLCLDMPMGQPPCGLLVSLVSFMRTMVSLASCPLARQPHLLSWPTDVFGNRPWLGVWPAIGQLLPSCPIRWRHRGRMVWCQRPDYAVSGLGWHHARHNGGTTCWADAGQVGQSQPRGASHGCGASDIPDWPCAYGAGQGGRPPVRDSACGWLHGNDGLGNRPRGGFLRCDNSSGRL